MRILLLTPSFPYPAHQGGALRNLGLIRGLIEAGHTVDLASFHDDPEAATDSQLAGELGSLEVVRTPARSTGMRLRSLALSLQPDLAMRLESDLMRAALRRLFAAHRYDIVQYEGLEMAIYLPMARKLAGNARHVYDAHNAEYLLQRRIAEVERENYRRVPMAVYSSIQSGRLTRFERAVCAQADAVIAVSDEDATALRTLAPQRPIHVVPNGITVSEYETSEASVELGPHALVFTGKMDYRPNVDAVQWFAEEILPEIQAAIPDVVLYVVGQRPHGSLQTLADEPSIHVTGFVTSVQPFLHAAAVYVAPLRMGSGTRLKLLEAMAAGCAVVATSGAASGLSDELLGALALADEPDTFAQAVVRILQQPDLRQQMSCAAREQVKAYDWAAILPGCWPSMQVFSMDRDALVRRNRAMTEALHKLPVKHLVRRAGLRAVSALPVQTVTPGERPRFLLIRPDHLGDVLLATPAMRALKALRPNAEIHVLAGPWSADILETCDAVDQILTIPFPGFSRSANPNLRSPYELAWDTGRKLRLLRYSAALILRPDHWWGALVAWLAGIPVRIGYALPDVAPFLTNRVPVQRVHAVRQSAILIERLTGTALDSDSLSLRYTVSADDRAWVQGYLSEHDLQVGDRLIVLHAGAGSPIKLWDPQRWATVADRLAGQASARIILTGGEAEIPLARAIAGHMTAPPIVMAGDTRIGTLAALLERSALALGPDSGPLHLAAAVGTPTVALFGPADPDEFRPWGPPTRHLVLTSEIGCRPCRILDWPGDSLDNHPCVREITVERVVEAGHRALNAAN